MITCRGAGSGVSSRGGGIARRRSIARARLVRHPQPVLGRRHVGVLDGDLDVVAVAPLVRRVDDAHLGRLDRPQRPRRLGRRRRRRREPRRRRLPPRVGGAEAARARVGLQLAPAAARLQPARLRAEALLLVVEAERRAHRVARRREQRVVVAGDRVQRGGGHGAAGSAAAASAGGGGSQSSASPPAAGSAAAASVGGHGAASAPPAAAACRAAATARVAVRAAVGELQPRRRDDARWRNSARRAGGRPRRVRDEGAQRKAAQRKGDVRHHQGFWSSSSTWRSAGFARPSLRGPGSGRVRNRSDPDSDAILKCNA